MKEKLSDETPCPVLMMTVTDPSPPHDLIPTTTLRSLRLANEYSCNTAGTCICRDSFIPPSFVHSTIFNPIVDVFPFHCRTITSTSHHHQPSPDSLKLPVSDRIRTAHPACCIIVAQVADDICVVQTRLVRREGKGRLSPPFVQARCLYDQLEDRVLHSGSTHPPFHPQRGIHNWGEQRIASPRRSAAQRSASPDLSLKTPPPTKPTPQAGSRTQLLQIYISALQPLFRSPPLLTSPLPPTPHPLPQLQP